MTFGTNTHSLQYPFVQTLIDKSDSVIHHAYQILNPLFKKQMVAMYAEGQETRGINEENINDMRRKSTECDTVYGITVTLTYRICCSY